MAELTTRLTLEEDFTDKLSSIADAVSNARDTWESATSAMGSSLDDISLDGVISGLNDFGDAAQAAAQQTDYWTEAAANYDKTALELMNSTEELVNMGLKSEEALTAEQAAMDNLDDAASSLRSTMDDATDVHDELAAAMDKASEAADDLASSGDKSADAVNDLTKKMENAADAMAEMESAQKEAADALSEYESVTSSTEMSVEELADALANAGDGFSVASQHMQSMTDAAAKLADADQKVADATNKAADATADLTKATQDSSDASQTMGTTGVNALEGISNALTSLGITKLVKEITEAVIDMAEAFSDAESTIVKATGATGDALDGLTDSMMDAYAASRTGTLDETAEVVGEINTRLGYTGDTLTKTTDKFLDFASVTGTDASDSVATVTQLMNQWNVSADDMDAVLDELVYAGQNSGASIDSLAESLTSNKAVLDQLGFSLEDATALFMNFELYGTNASTVMTGFRTALSSGAISSLEDLYDVFEDINSGAMSATDASEMFGSRAGVAIYDAAQQGVFALDDMVAGLESADGTLETTADAAQTMSEKWEQATNKITAAFQGNMSPAIESMVEGLADVVGAVGDFLGEHPAVVAAIEGIAVGLGVAAVAFAGFSAAAAVSAAAATAFGTALSASLAPVLPIIIGVAAAIAGITAAMGAAKEVQQRYLDEEMAMTSDTRALADEIDVLQEQYDALVDAGEGTSVEAQELAAQIEELQGEFDATATSVTQLISEIDELSTAAVENKNAMEEAFDSADTMQEGSTNLVDRLAELQGQTSTTAAEQAEMASIVGILNDRYADLGLTVDSVTGQITNSSGGIVSTADIQDTVDATAAADKYAAAIEGYSNAYSKSEELQEDMASASRDYLDAQERLAELEAKRDRYADVGVIDHSYDEEIQAAEEHVAEMKVALDEASEGVRANADTMQEASEVIAEYNDYMASTEGIATTAAGSIVSEIQGLADAYNEAYEAAVASFEGQFGLFDEATANAEASVDALLKAQESQLKYWTEYGDNIDTLMALSAEDLGITQSQYDTLMQSVLDGSEEAAGLSASLVEAYNEGNTEIIETTAETMEEVNAKREEVAAETASWGEELNGDVQAAVDSISTTLEGLDLSDEGQAYAESTISAYITAMVDGTTDAETAMSGITDALITAMDATDEATTAAQDTVDAFTTAITDGAPAMTDTCEGVATDAAEAMDVNEVATESANANMEAYNTEVEDHEDQIVSTSDSVATSGAQAMDASAEAATAGDSTCNGFESEVASHESSFRSAGQSLGNAFVEGLNSALANVDTSTVVAGLATGSVNAPNVFVAGERGPEMIVPAHSMGTVAGEPYYLAGESGPELIVGMQGSTVFPTSETDRILAALEEESKPLYIEAEQSDKVVQTDSSGNKTITIEIKGSGSVSVDANTDPQAVIDIMEEQIEPILLSLLKQEVYEEGSRAYDY